MYRLVDLNSLAFSKQSTSHDVTLYSLLPSTIHHRLYTEYKRVHCIQVHNRCVLRSTACPRVQFKLMTIPEMNSRIIIIIINDSVRVHSVSYLIIAYKRNTPVGVIKAVDCLYGVYYTI